MQKLAHLQWLRAAAAILVVWKHAITVVEHNDPSALMPWSATAPDFGGFGVDIFFVISGFIVSLTALRSESPVDFLTRRAIRIWPLYALATILIYVAIPEQRPQIGLLARSLLFLQQPGDPYALPFHPYGWTLVFEVMFYCVLATALCWKTPMPLAWRAYVILGALIFTGARWHHQQPMNTLGNPIIIEFATGIFIGQLWLKKFLVRVWLPMVLLVTGVGLFILSLVLGIGRLGNAHFVVGANLSIYRVFIWGVPAALIVAAVVFWPGRIWKCASLEFLGDASYSIYLFSYIALKLIELHWPSFVVGYPGAMIVAITFTGIAFGAVAYVAIEQPLQKWVVRWTFAKRARQYGDGRAPVNPQLDP